MEVAKEVEEAPHPAIVQIVDPDTDDHNHNITRSKDQPSPQTKMGSHSRTSSAQLRLSLGRETKKAMLLELQKRRSEIVEELGRVPQMMRQNIFATIRAGFVWQLHTLLSMGIYSATEKDYNGSTPLHVAAHEGRQDMASVLLSFGADVNAVDARGRTPRDVAVGNRHTSLGRFILLAAKKAVLEEQQMREDSGGLGEVGQQSFIDEGSPSVVEAVRAAQGSSVVPPPLVPASVLGPHSPATAGVKSPPEFAKHLTLHDRTCSTDTGGGRVDSQLDLSAVGGTPVSYSVHQSPNVLRSQGNTKSASDHNNNIDYTDTGAEGSTQELTGHSRQHSLLEEPGMVSLGSAVGQSLLQPPTRSGLVDPRSEDLITAPSSQEDDRGMSTTSGQLEQGQGVEAITHRKPTDVVVTPTLLHQTEAVTMQARTSGDNINEQAAVSLVARFSRFTTISDHRSVVLCMVGLPGRGKSFISKRVARYLNWKGVPCKVFNAGNYRREILGVDSTAKAGFFDPTNEEAVALRDKMAQFASDDLCRFLYEHPVAVGILDATNTTVSRRKQLIDFFKEKVTTKPCKVVFIESKCDKEAVVTENILRAKCGNDDFKCVANTAEVVREFRNRIKQYERVYETLKEEENLEFIRMINVKEHIEWSRISGGISTRIAFFLLNLHPVSYPAYLVLPCETEGDRENVFGGDSRLTDAGMAFRSKLHHFVEMRTGGSKMAIVHGTNPGVLDSVKGLDAIPEAFMTPMRCLDDINFGVMAGETFQAARKHHPKISNKLFVDQDPENLFSPVTELCRSVEGSMAEAGILKFNLSGGSGEHSSAFGQGESFPRLRYAVTFPRGESSRQVNVRLEPALLEIMRAPNPVMVVAPYVPAQGILAYLTDVLPEHSPNLSLRRHCVVEIGIKGEITVHDLDGAMET